jgi:dephospho-CoA kinase
MSTVLGLTGGIATGKSTVAHFFSLQNIPIIDSDRIVDQLLKDNSLIREKLILWYGKKIIKDGQVNRQELAKNIFESEQKREQLNGLIHPFVEAEIQKQLNILKKNYPLIVVDIPLLFEARMEYLVDEILCVYIPRDIQLERLMDRDQIDKSFAHKKIDAQLDIEQKKLQSTYVIDNSQASYKTQVQVEDLVYKLLGGSSWE